MTTPLQRHLSAVLNAHNEGALQGKIELLEELLRHPHIKGEGFVCGILTEELKRITAQLEKFYLEGGQS